jgi:hypothetical protein
VIWLYLRTLIGLYLIVLAYTTERSVVEGWSAQTSAITLALLGCGILAQSAMLVHERNTRSDTQCSPR